MGKVKEAKYNNTILRIINSGIDNIFAYWNISEEYNNSFIKKYGEDFFIKTKQILVLKNLSNGQEDRIEINEPTNNYYIKFKYSNAIYQVELLRISINDNAEFGYKIVSNKVLTPNIKILLNKYNEEQVRFRNIKNGEEYFETEYYRKIKDNKANIEILYNEHIIPKWNEYKMENGYREK